MAAKVNVCNVVVMDNPSSFCNPFQFQITFECFENLQEDLEWKLTYVGSAESDKYDQILDSVLVGPVPEGRHMFVFQADAPDSKKIPPTEAVGVTVILLSCAYRNQEFIKIGYFVQNDYEDPEMKENPPEQPHYDKLVRKIVSDEPRVTRFQIKWGDQEQMIPECTEDSSGDENSCAPMSSSPQNFVEGSSVSGPSAISSSAINSGAVCGMEDMRKEAQKINAGKGDQSAMDDGGPSGDKVTNGINSAMTNGDVTME